MPYSARLVGSRLTGPFGERARAGSHLIRLAGAGGCSRTSPDRCILRYGVVLHGMIAPPASECQAEFKHGGPISAPIAAQVSTSSQA